MEHTNVSKNPLKLRTCYTYNESMSRVFHVLKDNESMFSVWKDLTDFIYFTKGKGYEEVGSELVFKWKGSLLANARVNYIIDTDKYKSLQMYIYKVVPLNLVHWHTYHLYPNTCDGTTVLAFEDICQDLQSISGVDEVHSIAEKQIAAKKIEKILSNLIFALEQTESIMLDVSINRVWHIITNWKVFQVYVPMIGKSIEIKGNPVTIGSVISIGFEKTKELFYLKVVKVFEEDLVKEYVLKNEISGMVGPKQEIHFKLIDLNGTQCFLSFKHIFQEYVKADALSKISKEKIQILKTLKKSLAKIKES